MFGMIGSLLGSVASGLFGMAGQKSANDANAELDSTKYQRASADMQAAGLNPAAMYNGGTPAGAPVMQNTMAAPAAAMKDAASSATQQLIAQKTIDQLTSQIAKTKAEEANVRATTVGVGARSSLDARRADAINAIPKRIYVPLVQGGFGADTLRSTGTVGAITGAGVASAKSASDGIVSLGGPAGQGISSAKRQAAVLADALKEKGPALKKAVGNWWERTFPYVEPKYRTGKGSTYYKQ